MTSVSRSKAPFPGWFTDDYILPDDQEVKRNLEKWQDCKFGLMIHWGPYCQWEVVESWSICSEDLPWCARKSENYEEYKRDYFKLKTSFNPKKFNPEKLADVAENAGMKYLVFTVKHHDGFCMFDTDSTDNKITSPSCPYSANEYANITLHLFNAFRMRGMKIGIYFSKPDWNSPFYWSPMWATPDRNVNYVIDKHPDLWEKFVHYTHRQIDELTSNYGKVDILWLDGEWVRPTPSRDPETGLERQLQDIGMDDLVKIARKNQPGILIVDRWVHGKHENYLTPEQVVPGQNLPGPWESCMTIGDSWSFNSKDNIKSVRKLLSTLVTVVSSGGNFLLNAGLDQHGEFDPVVVQRLSDIGKWLNQNGEAIYNTQSTSLPASSSLSFTRSINGHLYAILFLKDEHSKRDKKFSVANQALKMITKGDKIFSPVLLNTGESLSWEKHKDGIELQLPLLNGKVETDSAVVIRLTGRT